MSASKAALAVAQSAAVLQVIWQYGTLGDVASVSESSSTVAPPPVAFAEGAADSAEKVPTPIEAGTTQVSVTLNVAWSIE